MNEYTSLTNPFRNYHGHDNDVEEDMEPIKSNEKSSLKSLSFDSNEIMEYVATVVGNTYSITGDVQSPQNKRRRITTYDDYDGNCEEAVSPTTTRTTTTATAITPVPEKKSHVANVGFDPIPESQLDSLISDCYCGTDNKEDHDHAGEANDRDSTITTTALQFKPSVFDNSDYNTESFSQSDTRLDEHDNNDRSSTTTNNEDNTILTLHNVDLHDGEVYRILKPLLPLDESLTTILLLLLHMELLSSASTSTTIDKSVVEDACEVVYRKLEPSNNNKDTQEIKCTPDFLADIFLTLHSTVDLATPLMASAITSDDQAINDKIQQIFLRQQEQENSKNESLSAVQTTATATATAIARASSAETEIIEVGRSQLLEVVTATTSTEGASTRNFSHDNDDYDYDDDDDDDHALPTTYENKNSILGKRKAQHNNNTMADNNFFPALLHLAIAYGASNYNNNNNNNNDLLSSRDEDEEDRRRPQTMTLEEFVKQKNYNLWVQFNWKNLCLERYGL
jgi:hypothetical protein